MSHWYEESFGLSYLELYAHRDGQEAHDNAQAIVELLSPPKDEPLLDLCCGAGRYLCALREMGFQRIDGLDLSEELLGVAACELTDPDSGCLCEGVQLIRGDMRDIPRESYYATILSLFTSFGYFEEDSENEAVLVTVYRALKPGGTYLLDYMNRDQVISHLVACDETVMDDRQVRNVRCLTQAGRRVEKSTTVTTADGVAHKFHESVRLYSEDEMTAMLEKTGFVNIRRYGSLRGDEYGPESPRLVLVAQKGANE